MCDVEHEWDSRAVYVRTEHAARKPRNCDSCGKIIQPKERYARHFAANDGYGSAEYCCLVCDGDIREFWKAHGGGALPYRFVGELAECIADDERNLLDSRWKPMLERIRERGRVAA